MIQKGCGGCYAVLPGSLFRDEELMPPAAERAARRQASAVSFFEEGLG